ncbi:MAG: hypothetical protein Kow0068_20760 [Marinilabiliales bacterium]
MEKYTFAYLTTKTTATIDDGVLHLKISPIIKKQISLEAIKYFYVHESKDYCTLIIRYEKNNGKHTNQRIIFAHLDNQALSFINSLSQKFPEKDLRGKSEKEALKILKATNTTKMALFVALIVMIIVPTIIFIPTIMHYFDSGKAEITVKELINGKDPGTNNLRLYGVVLNAGMWEKIYGKAAYESNYFPIVQKDWEEGDPVHILLDCGEMTQDEIDSLVYNTVYVDGVLKNILWEKGIDSEFKKFFKDEYDIEFADDALLFDITPQDTEVLFYIYIGVLFLMIIIWGILYYKQTRK